MLSLRLLGLPIIEWDGTAIGRFQTVKALALLAYLAIERSGKHSRVNLITLFWPDLPEDKARQNLSQTLTRLRAALGVAERFVQATRQEIWLDKAAPLALDVSDFWRFLDETERHPHDLKATCAACQAKLAQAVLLVRGDLLDGIALYDSSPFEEWLGLERERIRQLLSGALADLAEGALANGRYEAAIEYARRQTVLEPWRELAHCQLMQALALNGQRVEALAQYEKCRRVLSEELGVEPSSTTQQLAAEIRTEKTSGRKAGPSGAARTATPVGNLPGTLTPFIGRKTELAEIEQQLQTAGARLITIAGLGGTGKTRLALEVGRKLAAQPVGRWDGVWFIPLAGVNAADDVPLAVARALDIRLVDNETPAEAVINALRRRRPLLILDNFEHLPDARPWLLRLLQTASQAKALVTSRERLRLISEDVYYLEGLSTPPPETPLAQARDYDAVTLFIDLARRLDKQFRLDQNRWPDVARICRILEGLPLGIELTVSLLENATLADIAVQISQGAMALSGDALDIAPHQRSLLQVFENSWSYLAPAEREALARLALMRGVFTWEDALIVGATPPVTLNRLRHKSLLRAAGIGRLEIHELARQFAAVKLAQQSDWQQAAGQTHSNLYLGRIGDYVANQAALLPVIWESLDNIYAAWQWALEQRDTALLLSAVAGMSRFHADQSLYHTGVAQMEAVAVLYTGCSLQEMTAVERELVARALVCRSGLWADMNVDSEVTADIERALAVAPPDVDPGLLAAIAYQRGRVALHQGRSDEVLDIFMAGLVDARRGSDRAIEAALLRDAGSVYRQRGDYLTFIAYLEQALAIYQGLNDTVKIQSVSFFSGFYKAVAGHYWPGYLNLLAAQTLNEITGSTYHEASIESCLGYVESLLGQYESALARHQAAHKQLAVIDNAWRRVTLLIHLSATQIALGQLEEAAQSLIAAEQLAWEKNLAELLAYISLAEGYRLYFAGEWAAARERLTEAARQMARIKRPVGVAEAEILRAYIGLKRPERAHLVAEDMAAIEESLRFSAEQRLDGAYQRELLYWLAYQTAVALYPALAPVVLERGRAFVVTTARQIGDDAFRVSYLATEGVSRLLGGSVAAGRSPQAALVPLEQVGQGMTDYS
jgi:DNA-binding SARP family transcriptional activator/predicted ATPase